MAARLDELDARLTSAGVHDRVAHREGAEFWRGYGENPTSQGLASGVSERSAGDAHSSRPPKAAPLASSDASLLNGGGGFDLPTPTRASRDRDSLVQSMEVSLSPFDPTRARSSSSPSPPAFLSLSPLGFTAGPARFSSLQNHQSSVGDAAGGASAAVCGLQSPDPGHLPDSEEVSISTHLSHVGED